MKQVLTPSFSALAVILFPFANKTERVFELQPKGNYHVLYDSKISSKDTKLIMETTAAYNEQSGWSKVKLLTTTFNTIKIIVGPAKIIFMKMRILVTVIKKIPPLRHQLKR